MAASLRELLHATPPHLPRCARHPLPRGERGKPARSGSRDRLSTPSSRAARRAAWRSLIRERLPPSSSRGLRGGPWPGPGTPLPSWERGRGEGARCAWPHRCAICSVRHPLTRRAARGTLSREGRGESRRDPVLATASRYVLASAAQRPAAISHPRAPSTFVIARAARRAVVWTWNPSPLVGEGQG
jgi:hypothetical protein